MFGLIASLTKPAIAAVNGLALAGGPEIVLCCDRVLASDTAEQLMSEAQGLARRIAANAPLALRMTKRLIREGQQTRLETHLELCAAFMAGGKAVDGSVVVADYRTIKEAPNLPGSGTYTFGPDRAPH